MHAIVRGVAMCKSTDPGGWHVQYDDLFSCQCVLTLCVSKCFRRQSVVLAYAGSFLRWINDWLEPILVESHGLGIPAGQSCLICFIKAILVIGKYIISFLDTTSSMEDRRHSDPASLVHPCVIGLQRMFFMRPADISLWVVRLQRECWRVMLRLYV